MRFPVGDLPKLEAGIGKYCGVFGDQFTDATQNTFTKPFFGQVDKRSFRIRAEQDRLEPTATLLDDVHPLRDTIPREARNCE